MRKISGTYQRLGNLTDYEVEIAENWEELNAEQYAAILQVLTYAKADKHTVFLSLLSLLFKPKNFHILTYFDDEQLYALIPLIDFILNTRPPVSNKFPKLKINKKECFAPNDNLSNICFGEWCFAYQFYQLYYEFKDDTYLNMLIATLYRVADPEQTTNNVKFTGDVRQLFNENLIDKHALGVAAIPSHLKVAVLTWFSSALLAVMDARQRVFPKAIKKPEEAEATTDQEAEDTKGNITDWMTIFRELLGPKWGTTEQLKYTNAMFVLDGLEEQHIAFEEAKANSRV